ncbi:MAG TPA: hypothetical protein VF781_12585 [Solirubrobacteraceae bacterium]
MRPRHVLILAVLAALPLGLAVILAGGGGGASRGGGTAAGVPTLGRISLELVGAGPRVSVSDCGSTRHYLAYPAGGTIAFHGTVVPAGSWSVKLKLKACSGGTFQSAGDVGARVAANGSYAGTFPAPIAGTYFARAELKHAGAQVSRSTKVYFEVH